MPKILQSAELCVTLQLQKIKKKMKKFLLIAPLVLFAIVSLTATSCRFAASYHDGDTVAASVFEPEDTSAAAVHRRVAQRSVQTMVKDSVGMYYVGTGSTRQFLQLVSYPSKRDTLVYGKTRHVKVKGSADFNNVVRVRFYVLNGKDSLVSYVEQVDFLKVKE